MGDLYFGGSVWCNVDIALRRIDTLYQQETEVLGVSVVEWYVLLALYEQDGQMPSHLAEHVGRPATSFTPILDQIENKKLIERRPHPADRRAVQIYLTSKGKALQKKVQASAEHIENQIRQQVSENDWQRFVRVLADLQAMTR